MTQDKKAPKLRFKGFTDDWEQKKLGEVLSSFDYGLNAASKKYDGKNKYLRITDIDDITHKFKYDNLTSPKSNDIISNNFKLNTGDIVFARTGASVGKTYQYDINDGDVYFAGYLIRGKTLPQNNPSFIFDTTLLDKYKNFVRIMSIRSGQPGINAEEYKKYNIFIPKYTEQNKVANLLKKISDFEATQQRKLDQLKLLKKGLLQKMFADEKSKVPEIRFKGFDGEWEQCKIQNIASVIGGGTPSTKISNYWDGDINWYSPTEIGESTYISESHKKITKDGLRHSSAKLLPGNKTILFTSRAGIGDMAIMTTDGTTNQGFQSWVINPDKTNIYFLYSVGNFY